MSVMSTTLPMSRFIQNYKQHLTIAEQSDAVIVLEQRAGQPSWVLESEQRARTTAEATNFVSAALSAIAHDEALIEQFATKLLTTLPWVAFLPARDRESFVIESTETLRACASIGRYTAFADLIEDWRNTADIHSDPELAAALSGDIAEPLGQRV